MAILIILALVGIPGALALYLPDSSRNQQSSQTGVATSQATPDPLAGIAVGPTFQQVDFMMDDRRSDLTDAQRQQYWNTIANTAITWTGTIHNVYLDGGGSASIQCNPQSLLSDTRVYLDGTQMSLLPQLRKGQQITIRGTLNNHTVFGYVIQQGRIVN